MDLLLRTRLCQWDHYSFWSTALGTNLFSVLLVRSSTLRLSSSPASIHSHTETPEANRDPWKVWISLRMKLLKCFICSASDLIIIARQRKTLFSERGVGSSLKNQESSRSIRKHTGPDLAGLRLAKPHHITSRSTTSDCDLERAPSLNPKKFLAISKCFQEMAAQP